MDYEGILRSCRRRWTALATVLTLLIALYATSCSPQRKVSRQSETRSDTVVRYVDKVKTDSCYIYERDSVRVEVAGDTVRMERYIYRYRDRIKTDTLIRGDTITRTSYTDRETVKQKDKWSNMWWLIIITCVGLVIWQLIRRKDGW